MTQKLILSVPVPPPVPTHVLFRLDAHFYGIPLSQIAGVSLSDGSVTDFPRFQDLARFDLRILLRLPGRETGKEAGLIVLASRRIAFLVDSIEDVLLIESDSSSRGTIRQGDWTITLLDLPSLLSPESVPEYAESAYAEAA